MSGSHDKLPGLFWVQLVLAAIVLILFITADKPAKIAHASTSHGETKETVKEVVKQAAKILAPVGEVAVKKEAKAGAGSGKSGETIYKETCGVCHNAGIAGAPKLDDKATWVTRLEGGLNALVASATNGKGGMPARGGNPDISDSEMQLVVGHMIKKAGIELVAKSSSMTKKAETVAPKMTETPVAPAAPAAPAAPDTTTAVSTVATTTTEASTAASAETLAKGDRVYKSACFACHDAGVAGSPKIGDAAAWTARIAAGNDAMYNAAINGKGVMPPKGGNMGISDEDVKAAVDYMVSKSQ